MKSAVPKHLHPLLGRRVVDWVIEAARGAGAAARVAATALEGFTGDLIVLYGDVPALPAELVRELLAAHRAENAAATVLSFEPPDPLAYGRIVRDDAGRLARIVEARDA